MILFTLTYNLSRSSGIEIAILGILVVLLNLRALSIITKAKFLIRLQENLLLGILPISVISIIIMINQLIAAIKAN